MQEWIGTKESREIIQKHGWNYVDDDGIKHPSSTPLLPSHLLSLIVTARNIQV
jgi:hypothetical protein